MQLPSPPQRRLSRSSIDLRDLEQQQHEKVTHTDSAPSIIVTDNFNFEIKKKSANSLQPLLLHKDFLIAPPPIDCLNIKLNAAGVGDDDDTVLLNKNYNHELDILRDNDQLARFIEDNYFYYKKQSSSSAQCSATAVIDDKHFMQPQNHHIGALSESDFVTFQNGSMMNDEWKDGQYHYQHLHQHQHHPHDNHADRKNSKQKMLACSDSDFIVSYGSSTKKLSLKSRLQFARSLLTGSGRRNHQSIRKPKLETTSPNNASATVPTVTLPVASTTSSGSSSNPNKGSIFFRKGKFGMLSKSCNGCYSNKSPETPDIRSLQRVLSEGNNKCSASGADQPSADVDLMDLRPSSTTSPQQQTAVDIFLKLIDFEQGAGEKQSSVPEENLNNFNYELTFNSKYETYCDQLLLLNLKTDNCNVAANSSTTAKMNSLCDFSVLQQNNVHSPRSHHSKMSRSEQLVLINRCVDDRNVSTASATANSEQSSCNNLYGTGGGGSDHVFVNSFVLNSPPPQTIQSSNDCSRNSHFSFSPTTAPPPMDGRQFDDPPLTAAMTSESVMMAKPPPLPSSPPPPPPSSTTLLESNGLHPPSAEAPIRIVPQILAINESESNLSCSNANGNISLILLNEHHSSGGIVVGDGGYMETGLPNNGSVCQHQTPIIKKDRSARHRHSSVVTYDINVINHHAADDLSSPGEAAGYSGGKRFSTNSTTANNMTRQSTSSASKHKTHPIILRTIISINVVIYCD